MMCLGVFSNRGKLLATLFMTALWFCGSYFISPNSTFAQDEPAIAGNATPAKSGALVRFSPGTERTIKAEQALQKNVSLKFDELPFAEVERELEKLSGLNFILDQSASDDSLAADQPISFELTNVPMSKAITLLLQQYNATYAIDDGIVVLISIDVSSDGEWTRVKMYDCNDLLKVLLAENRPDPSSEQTLVDMVQSMAVSDIFGDEGVFIANGVLVARQTEKNHQGIKKFLADLEAGVLSRTRPDPLLKSGGTEPGVATPATQTPTRSESKKKARVFNLPPVSSAKTADQLIRQLETETYSRPTLPLSQVELDKTISKLRDRFPLRSIRERLQFQTKEPALIDYQPEYSGRRTSAFALLHSEQVESFLNQAGQGISRITPVRPQDLFAKDSPLAKKALATPIDSALRAEEAVEIDKTVKMTKSRARRDNGKLVPDSEFIQQLSPSGLPKQQTLFVFNDRAADSFAKQKTGHVKSIDEVAGFEAHRVRLTAGSSGGPIQVEAIKAKAGESDPKFTWRVNRFQLVSLLMHEQPCVYDVDELPNMENLSSDTVNTRQLSDFETAGMEALESGEDLFVRATKNRILMTGAIRASKQCLSCHANKEGDLLGAFSYEFLRQPRFEAPRLGKKSF